MVGNEFDLKSRQSQLARLKRNSKGKASDERKIAKAEADLAALNEERTKLSERQTEIAAIEAKLRKDVSAEPDPASDGQDLSVGKYKTKG
jgi:hypothetical protein